MATTFGRAELYCEVSVFTFRRREHVEDCACLPLLSQGVITGQNWPNLIAKASGIGVGPHEYSESKT